ncbi:hypothetical protein [Romboutsia ilealis]|uniref:hypothetical protein n=1 Tax=Romboutsia ilealis TaxID=1115758 RepID=UPI00272B48E6|nr:hypothetical protein [Romboutsia ilealis]
MSGSSTIAIILAIIILIQLLLIGVNSYYDVMVDIFSGDKKIRNMDVILIILFLPSSLFIFIDIKILNSDILIKRIRGSKIYNWLKTEVNIKK